MIRKLLALILWIGLLFLLLGGPAVAQKYGGIMKIAHWGNPPSMSIHEESTISTFLPAMSVFNNLVLYDQAKPRESLDTIQPELASSWTWSDGGRELTFRLRRGVKWHDGRPFTSGDVKYTWELLQGKSKKNLRKNPRKIWYRNLDRITTKGDYEVTFHLKRPQPSFLALIAGGAGAVYPAHVSPERMRTHPIGTGPFRFVEYKKNDKVVLTKNKDYWVKDRPYLDGWVALLGTAGTIAVKALITGKVDVMWPGGMPRAHADKIRSGNAKIVVSQRPNNASTNLLLNHKAPPFNNPKLRQAIALVIDRRPYAEHDMGGAMPPTGVWGLPLQQLKKLPGYGALKRRRDKARAIMRELGYGPDRKLKFNLAARNFGAYRDPGLVLIESLRKIFVEAELDLDSTPWHVKLSSGDFLAAINLTGLKVDDPDANFYENYYCNSPRNYSQYCNPKVDRMIDEQSSELDPAKRLRLVHAIDRKLQQDFARPIIIHLVNYRARQPYVKGFHFHHGIYNAWRFQDVWLDK